MSGAWLPTFWSARHPTAAVRYTPDSFIFELMTGPNYSFGGRGVHTRFAICAPHGDPTFRWQKSHSDTIYSPAPYVFYIGTPATRHTFRNIRHKFRRPWLHSVGKSWCCQGSEDFPCGPSKVSGDSLQTGGRYITDSTLYIPCISYGTPPVLLATCPRPCELLVARRNSTHSRMARRTFVAYVTTPARRDNISTQATTEKPTRPPVIPM